jgi:hypothetical protein
MKSLLTIALVAAATACGGKAAPGTEPAKTGDPHDMRAGSAQPHAAAMPPSVSKFHDTLAPRWHAAKGPQRTADTCAAVDQLAADAAAIVAAPTPEATSAASWSDGGKQLAAAVTALGATCKTGDATAFEPAFEHVHTSFHRVMESAARPGAPAHDEHAPH